MSPYRPLYHTYGMLAHSILVRVHVHRLVTRFQRPWPGYCSNLRATPPPPPPWPLCSGCAVVLIGQHHRRTRACAFCSNPPACCFFLLSFTSIFFLWYATSGKDTWTPASPMLRNALEPCPLLAPLLAHQLNNTAVTSLLSSVCAAKQS